jgi:RNA polymerase sigma-70 factor (ECF subfamily)
MIAAHAPLPETTSAAAEASDEDRALVGRLLRRDEAAFLALVDKLNGPMIRIAQSMVPSRAVAEEVAQETWQAVITGLATFEGRSSLRTWVFRILVKRARTRGVREHRSIPVPSFVDGGEMPEGPLRSVAGGRAGPGIAASQLTPERALLDGELRSRLEAAIEALPEPLRQVLTMRDIAGCSSDEVCSVLDISETNQRVMLHRARVKVRAALVEYLEGEP